ncbi:MULTISPECIES: ATP-dependent DNA helicase [unclassified Cryobacterium]|uniref:ATP-dependent DNA helicase n=1 Tax=unclassified Cryobacterium TaxID=2649013 RepID=UPI002AB35832|nr:MULTISPECIES: AAA family ATPase [unclassified Cryobacterium]MDY7542214.1 AAA family ATPase [Cryobacterium sp. 5B3]MEA9999102.1 AAA family ATPase [Cryobacterium sp. RTS3]MEB0265037.1 AAA family ATPase [Cryobacterium sp. 10I5]MEB0275091.1 AAA family ATPase [Cryobacterium sp. 5B3]
MSPISLSREQAEVYQAIENTRQNVFVTGRAGTGKSTLLNHLSWNTSKQIVIAAPTGVAALNVGGQTIHSLFRLPIGVIADHAIDQNDQVKKLLNTIDTVVIDEVSMVNADLMDAIDRSLRQARQRPNDSFGGVQIVLFGDPYQLAPVPGDSDERAYFTDTYRSMWFFDAKVWKGAELRIFELTEVHRQRDADFRHMLNAVRYGQVTAEIGGALNAAGARTPPTEGVITLATRNDAVNRINAAALKRLPGKALTAKAEVTGDFGGRTYPADAVLELKVGAQVMFLRNDSPLDGGPRWVNGSIGTVTKVNSTVFVEIDGTTHEVEPAVWEKYKYSYNQATKKLSRDVVAEFTQFPLRLAWAVTIHKSQGATYERAIVDLGTRVFSPGQTYVALSRLTNLDGLYLTRPLRPSDIIVDEDVQRFMGSQGALPAA